MKHAPHPSNEKARLKALVELDILDSEDEESYAGIVRLASLICGTEDAGVALVDRDRHWFKASLKVGVSETPRDISFCAHAILEDEALIVEDATRDERFHDNPLVRA